MYLHATTGTIDFMTSLQEKNPHVSISARGPEAILYYEDNNEKSIFSTNMTYEVLNEQGSLDEELPLSMYYIPAAGDGTHSLRGHLSDLAEKLRTVNGAVSYRVGINTRDENYLVLIKWADMSIYNDFKHTDVYEKYLTSESLKSFRNEESLFGDFLSSKLYYNIEDNEYTDEEKEELGD